MTPVYTLYSTSLLIARSLDVFTLFFSFNSYIFLIAFSFKTFILCIYCFSECFLPLLLMNSSHIFVTFFISLMAMIYFFLCICVYRSRSGLCCLPTSLCQHACGSAVGCDLLLHAALPWTGQRGSSWGNWGNNIAALETYRKKTLFALILKSFWMTRVFFFSFLTVCNGWSDGDQFHGWILSTTDSIFQAKGAVRSCRLWRSFPFRNTLCHAGRAATH